MSQPQSYKNHARFDPMFHFFVLPFLLLNVIASIVWYVRHRPTHIHSGPWIILLSIALFMLAGLARGYALKAQDRVIRLEERLRIAGIGIGACRAGILDDEAVHCSPLRFQP